VAVAKVIALFKNMYSHLCTKNYHNIGFQEIQPFFVKNWSKSPISRLKLVNVAKVFAKSGQIAYTYVLYFFWRKLVKFANIFAKIRQNQNPQNKNKLS
jgi:hypothetical protein